MTRGVQVPPSTLEQVLGQLAGDSWPLLWDGRPFWMSGKAQASFS